MSGEAKSPYYMMEGLVLLGGAAFLGYLFSSYYHSREDEVKKTAAYVKLRNHATSQNRKIGELTLELKNRDSQDANQVINQLLSEATEYQEKGIVHYLLSSCKICYEEKGLVVMVPCGHVYSCNGCASEARGRNFHMCGICNQPYSEFYPFYVCFDEEITISAYSHRKPESEKKSD